MKSEAWKFIYWPNIDQDIESITKSCDLCFTNNAPKGIKFQIGKNLSWHGNAYILII